MAGRRTFRHPKPQAWISTTDEWPTLKLATWHALEDALGRPLIDRERNEVARAVERAQFWKDRATESASADDVKATLAALAKLPPEERAEAYRQCDATTHAVLVHALWKHGERDPYPTDPETIAAAARDAAANIRAPRGRRLTWKRMLAGRAVELWRAFGGAPYSVSTSAENATPPVRFGVALFDAMSQPIEPAAFCRLVAPAQRKGEIS